jgi:outer membrane protein assembly factor BamB
MKWQTELEKIVLNASVCVADTLEHTRAFITDYDGFGTTGKLYCINLDANEPNNHYQPGEIIWTDTLGSTSGNTPGYKNGFVYVSSNMDDESYSGAIYAYDANAGTAIRLWKAANPNFEGFTSGLTITKEGFIYAACYDWADSNENNSALCKINSNNGNIIWITDAERTSTAPVVVGDKIYISGGINGYGSRPKVTAFEDLGSNVTKLWETPLGMFIGGWTNQPVYANGKLYVGAIPENGNYFGAYEELYVLDINAPVDSPKFVISHYTGHLCGNNPAVTFDSLYTIGLDGLLKFHQPALLADINKDNAVNIFDLVKITELWLLDDSIGKNRADLNLDGKVDFADFALLAGQWYGDID